MAEIDTDRRKYINDKNPAINAPRPMDPALNLTDLAIKRGERIEAILAQDSLRDHILFDPDWCPKLHDQLVAELEALHALSRQGGRAVYQTFHGERYDPHDPADSSTSLKFPGDRRIFVCRNNADRLAAMVERMGPWGVCDVCIADDCHSTTDNDQPTRPLPIACGRVVLVFEICAACEFVAEDTAFYNMRSSA
jgi:hypothetical protein